jgi:phosphatidylserine decarboxylase
MLSPHMFRSVLGMRLHPKGWPFVCGSLGVTVFFMWLNFGRFLSLLGLGLTVFMLFFFRNPPRVIPAIDGALISPADGMIVEITSHQSPPEELGLSDDTAWTKIGIFLSPLDVHVNRSPVHGTIAHKAYVKGTFHHVATAETRLTNERLSLILDTPNGERVVCIQIAGFLARRIICDVDVGHTMSAGDLYGLICFGSRVDLYVSPETALLVSPFQKVVGGETVLGFLPSSPYAPHRATLH